MKFKIWSVIGQKFLSESEIFHSRIAIGVNGKVYSGLYDSFDEKNLYVVYRWTGLKDVEGKDIYEGDIVRNDYGANFLCEYNNRDACFQFLTVGEHAAYGGPYMWSEIESTARVLDRIA